MMIFLARRDSDGYIQGISNGKRQTGCKTFGKRITWSFWLTWLCVCAHAHLRYICMEQMHTCGRYRIMYVHLVLEVLWSMCGYVYANAVVWCVYMWGIVCSVCICVVERSLWYEGYVEGGVYMFVYMIQYVDVWYVWTWLCSMHLYIVHLYIDMYVCGKLYYMYMWKGISDIYNVLYIAQCMCVHIFRYIIHICGIAWVIFNVCVLLCVYMYYVLYVRIHKCGREGNIIPKSNELY